MWIRMATGWNSERSERAAEVAVWFLVPALAPLISGFPFFPQHAGNPRIVSDVTDLPS